VLAVGRRGKDDGKQNALVPLPRTIKKETLRRRTVTSSFKELSKDQLGNIQIGLWRGVALLYLPPPLSTAEAKFLVPDWGI
jgi:hypothetical protein